MDLSNVAKTKLGGTDAALYRMLKAATPDTRFTRGDQILVQFVMPEMKDEDNGPVNGAKITDASERGKRALDTIDGLVIDNFAGGLGSAMISGSAQAIAQALNLPEVEAASSMKGVTVVTPETRKERRGR